MTIEHSDCIVVHKLGRACKNDFRLTESMQISISTRLH